MSTLHLGKQPQAQPSLCRIPCVESPHRKTLQRHVAMPSPTARDDTSNHSVSLGWRVQPQGSANCPSWNSAPLTLSARCISRGRSPATAHGGPACSPLPRASAVQGQGPGKAQIPKRVMLCSLALLISLKNVPTVSCQQPFNFQDRCFCSYLESECEGNFGKKEH